MDPRWNQAYDRLMRVPASAYFGILVALPLALVLLARSSWIREHVLQPYLWQPILLDQGYTPLSTAVLILVALVLLLWFLRLLRTYNEHADTDLVIGILPFFAWGPIFRVLEDADIFAPLNDALLAHDPSATLGAPCSLHVPGSFLDQCLGVFFVTPPIWIWACLLIFLWARLGLFATQVGEKWGPRKGLLFFGWTLAAHELGHVALWMAQPSWIRFVPDPTLTLAAALLGFFIVQQDAKRHGQVRWRRALLAYALLPLALGIHYVLHWFWRDIDSWTPTKPTHPWILAALVLTPLLLGLALWLHGRELAKGQSRKVIPKKVGAFLVYVVLIEAYLMYGALVQLARAVEPPKEMMSYLYALVLAAAAVGGGVYVVRSGRLGRWGGHPRMAVFADPVNVLVVASQAADALMTAISIALYKAGEKHVLPRAMIDGLASTGFPDAAAVVMILYKVPLALGLVWILDRRLENSTPTRRDFAYIVKMGAAAVGFIPAVRDALRLAMGV